MKTIKTLIISTSLAKWKRRVVGMALFISILLGVAAPAAGAFGPEGQQPDPFAEMVDAFTDPYSAARGVESTESRMPVSHLRELDPNAGKSDRYIVPYGQKTPIKNTKIFVRKVLAALARRASKQ